MDLKDQQDVVRDGHGVGSDSRCLHRFIDHRKHTSDYRKNAMSCLTGRHLGGLVGETRFTLVAGLTVVAMCDDRSIGNLRVEARHPRERIKSATRR